VTELGALILFAGICVIGALTVLAWIGDWLHREGIIQ
jgi:hypothetical protein